MDMQEKDNILIWNADILLFLGGGIAFKATKSTKPISCRENVKVLFLTYIKFFSLDIKN